MSEFVNLIDFVNMSIARDIVNFAIEAGSSDIHLEENSNIAVRVNSDIKVSLQKIGLRKYGSIIT